MSDATSPLADEIVDILAHIGVLDADGSTLVQSLSLAWVVHELEQRRGITIELTDEQLASATDVDALVRALETALPGGGA